VSHEWLSYSHPDPDGEQLRVMQAAFASVIAGHNVFRTKEDWKLYSQNLRHDADVDNDEDLLLEAFRKSVAGGYVWIDYAGVPQASSSREAQGRAIQSIPHYVVTSDNFWVCAPPCTHKDMRQGIFFQLSWFLSVVCLFLSM
jgi:hypothetical protein